MSLVHELQRAALDPSVDIDGLLRTALVVAAKLKLAGFKEWVEREINGYKSDDELPEYRVFHGQSALFNPELGCHIPAIYHGGDITILKAITRVQLTEKISEVAHTLRRARESGRDELARYFGPEKEQALMRMQNDGEPMRPAVMFTAAKLVGVISAVQNTVLGWSLKLEEEGIVGEGMTFSKKEQETAASKQEVLNLTFVLFNSSFQSNSPGAQQSVDVR